MNKNIKEDPIRLDEAWWTALLSEEEKHCQPSPNHFSQANNAQETKQASPESPNKSATVDWERTRHLFEQDEVIELKVTGYNRGGLLVGDDNLHGFVPISHLVDIRCNLPESERDAMLANYVGRMVALKVIEFDPDRGRVVFSERAALATAGRRNQLFDGIKPGDCLWGVVTNITEFGVFVDLGGVEGLIHVSELSWGRVHHPSAVTKVGDELTVHVINIDKSRSRIALSLKRLHPNPWETVEKRYQQGQVIEAVITSVVPFGAFARLEEGLDGLIHASEMGLADSNTLPSDVLREGQHIQARILNVDAEKQRLGLSLVLGADS